MAKKTINNNKLKLIKKSTLLKQIKNNGITRVSKDALNTLTNNIHDDINNLILKLKQNIQTNAKKTLEKSDIQEVYSNLNKKEDFDY